MKQHAVDLEHLAHRALLIGLVVVASFALLARPVPRRVHAAALVDVAGTRYEAAVTDLFNLKVLVGYPDGTYRPHNPMTRAELAAVTARLLPPGDDLAGAAAEHPFPDVPLEHWAVHYVAAAKRLAIFVGYPDGTFRPDQDATFAELVTVVLRATGHGPAAEARGPWPEGYLALAEDLGLLDGIETAPTAAIHRGGVALIWRAAIDQVVHPKTGLTPPAGLRTLSGPASPQPAGAGGDPGPPPTPPAVSLTLELSGIPASSRAGDSFTLTVAARDQYGQIARDYAGTKLLTFSGAAPAPSGAPPTVSAGGPWVPFGSPVEAVFEEGVTTVAARLFRAETARIGVTDGSLSGTGSPWAVEPGPLAGFLVTAPGTATAGTQFEIASVAAVDAWGNLVTGYAGLKALGYEGPGYAPDGRVPEYPASVEFAGGIASAIPVTLYRAETVAITVVADGARGTSDVMQVRPGRASRLEVSDGTRTAGEPFEVTVTARDDYGNPVSEYEGDKTVTWAWTATPAPDGTAPVKPADGVQTFTGGVLTVGGFTLYRAGENPTITAAVSEDSLAGTSQPYTVGPGPLAWAVITSSVPPTLEPGSYSPDLDELVASVSGVVAATTYNLAIRLQDAWGNPRSDAGIGVDLQVTSSLVRLEPSRVSPETVVTVGGTASFTYTSGSAALLAEDTIRASIVVDGNPRWVRVTTNGF